MHVLPILLAGALGAAACSSNKKALDHSPGTPTAAAPKQASSGQEGVKAIPAPLPPDASIATAPSPLPAVAVVPNTVRLVMPINEAPKRSERRLLERLSKKLEKLGELNAEASSPEEIAYLAQLGSNASLPASWLPYETVIFFGPGIAGVFHPPAQEPVYLERRGDDYVAISEDMPDLAIALKPEAASPGEESTRATN